MGKVKTAAVVAPVALLFNWEGLGKADSLLRVIDHPTSQKLLHAIYRHKEVSLVTLCKELGPQQDYLPRHLALLHQAGYLTFQQKGRTRLYSVNESRLKRVLDLVKNLV